MVSEVDKVVTHSVDMQTLAKFKGSKKMKTWLHAHPNFIKQDGKYVHIYEDSFVAWHEYQQDHQDDVLMEEIEENTEEK